MRKQNSILWHEKEMLKRVVAYGPLGYSPEFCDKDDRAALNALKRRGIIEGRPGGPRGSKRWFLVTEEDA
tara:strand:+ start:1180 stop:1389 length:210 start_codon:yes stop_codon:yes gene_type:complete